MKPYRLFLNQTLNFNGETLNFCDRKSHNSILNSEKSENISRTSLKRFKEEALVYYL